MKNRKTGIIVAFLLLAVLSAALFYLKPMKPDKKALEALISDEKVRVDIGPVLEFIPEQNQKKTGFIFYPGALVSYQSYAQAGRYLAEKGINVFIVPMPLNIAILGMNKAERIMENNTNISDWVIGGHSLGGVAAAMYIYKHPELIRKLILWASYPSRALTLDRIPGLEVLSLYGSRDDVLKPEKLKNKKCLLPSGTRYVEIQGGNHAQFGNYGKQRGDGMATIPDDMQLNQALEETYAFITGDK